MIQRFFNLDRHQTHTHNYELRITTGPAYRVYFTKRNEEIIILLVGGDKSTQSRDIKKAHELLEEYDDEEE